jgi:class 3 adenylate cyclase
VAAALRILLFGKNRRPRSKAVGGAKGLAIESYPIGDVETMVPSLGEGTLVYLDLAGLSETQRKKILTTIPDNPRILFGVLDPAGAVADVAALFHAGAVDYLGRKMRGSRLSAKRISRALLYADGGERTEQVVGDAQSDQRGEPLAAVPSGDAWSGVISGKENHFAILFVEVDGSEELKKRHEPENLAGAMESFRSYVERIASRHGGRTWMWSQFGGLVLFPLRSGASSAPVCGLRLLLSRIFYDVEESRLPGRMSFHLALSIGTTVYHERDTGKIISDSLNSVFHLGKRYTRPGQFFISANAMGLVPPKLKVLCVPVGMYERKRVFRMVPPRPLAERPDGDGQKDA